MREIRSELETVLIVKPCLALMRRKCGSGKPHFRIGSRAGGDWDKREDVAVRLREHPDYMGERQKKTPRTWGS